MQYLWQLKRSFLRAYKCLPVCHPSLLKQMLSSFIPPQFSEWLVPQKLGVVTIRKSSFLSHSCQTDKQTLSVSTDHMHTQTSSGSFFRSTPSPTDNLLNNFLLFPLPLVSQKQPSIPPPSSIVLQEVFVILSTPSHEFALHPLIFIIKCLIKGFSFPELPAQERLFSL